MSLESFYGGKQGISPVIKNHFKYIDTQDPAYQVALNKEGTTELDLKPDTMDLCFIDSSYEEVWYNELCIIDTTNKNNPNNGKLFRRTLKGHGDTGENLCAEYIGQIVGPAGANPFMSFTSLKEVKDKIDDINTVNKDTAISWPNGLESTSTLKPDKDTYPYIFDASTSNKMIVPGKDENGNYNDNIRYTWVNIVNNTTENAAQSMVYLGFQIPYPSIDITTTTIDWNEKVSSTKTTEGEHPFYHSWNIQIPRGIRGNTATNIRLAQLQDFKNWDKNNKDKPFLYAFKDLTRSNSGSFFLKEGNLGPELPASLPIDSYIWVYDYIFYDNDTVALKGEYHFYLGSYKEISNINLGEDGSITFQYTDGSSNAPEQKIKWIKDINIDNNGKLTVTYNTKKSDGSNKNETFEKNLPFPESMEINENGNITTYFTNRSSKILLNKGENTNFALKYVDKLSMDQNTKALTFTTFPGEESHLLNKGIGLNYIEDMVVDSRFHLMVYYSSSQFRPSQDEFDRWKENKELPNNITEIKNDSGNHNDIIWKGRLYRDNITYWNGKENVADSRKFWRDFGLIRETMRGIRIFNAFNFDLLPESQKAELITYKPDKLISDVLNKEKWGKEGNPYYEGKGIEKGTFGYTTEIDNGVGSAFFYDYGKQTWVCAGTWNELSNVDSDILLKEKDGNNDIYVRKGKDHQDGALIFKERTNQNITNNLPNFWQKKNE